MPGSRAGGKEAAESRAAARPGHRCPMHTSPCPSPRRPAKGIPMLACAQSNPARPKFRNPGTRHPLASRLSSLEHFLQQKQALPFLFLMIQVANLGLGGAWRRLEPWQRCPGTLRSPDVPKRCAGISRSFEAPSEDKGGPTPRVGGLRLEGLWGCLRLSQGTAPGDPAPSLPRGALTICSLCRA